MHTIRIPAHAPLSLPLPPPPSARRTNPVAIILAVAATALGFGMYVALCVVAVIVAILVENDATAATSEEQPTKPALAVDHMGDDCTAAALRAAHTCENMECFAATTAELRECLAVPEQSARACADVPDPSNTAASASWIAARCTFEEDRDQNDCARLMSIVQDHCANVGASSQH